MAKGCGLIWARNSASSVGLRSISSRRGSAVGLVDQGHLRDPGGGGEIEDDAGRADLEQAVAHGGDQAPTLQLAPGRDLPIHLVEVDDHPEGVGQGEYLETGFVP